MERIKKELLNALTVDMDRLTAELSHFTHEQVKEAVEKRLSGVVSRLERGVASGLAVIATEVKGKIDKQVQERFALIASEVRLRLRKLESKVSQEKMGGKRNTYDPNINTKMPPIIGDEMQAVQAEC